jgi:excisionase family DNA binding protein
MNTDNRSEQRSLLDVASLAEYLGVSRSWVYQAAANGELPVVRIGSLLRFEPQAVQAWLRARSERELPSTEVRS